LIPEGYHWQKAFGESSTASPKLAALWVHNPKVLILGSTPTKWSYKDASIALRLLWN
jgi:hypothetical protein